LTCRVHPGETPASYLLEAIINLILSNTHHGESLRRACTFKIIPMLNPDGVCRGNFRLDSNGVNLNRMYDNPDLALHPSIFAVKYYI